MRGVRGPKSTVPSSAILGGSVAAERSYSALGTLTPGFPVPGGGGVCETGALCWLYVLSFHNRPNSLISRPFVLSQIPCFVPQEKKSARCCRFESLSDSGFIAPNMAFYRPYKLLVPDSRSSFWILVPRSEFSFLVPDSRSSFRI